MIPYFEWTHFFIGPVRIQVWGLFVAIGILVGVWFAQKLAEKRGLDAKAFGDILFWIVVWSFVGARLGHVFLYEFGYYSQNLMEIFKVWHGGFSSYGGFLGGVISGYILLRKYQDELLSYADCGVYGLSAGWTIGRIGCFMIHDHPGTLSDFFLAVQQPDGGARHDLGLYDGLLSLFIFSVLVQMNRRKCVAGMLTAVAMVLYGAVRFFLDFLRVGDVRFFALTPAQYLSVSLVLWGLWLGKVILTEQR